ncbi:TadE/TadG family type IV pilus assembly protein [Kitasatospora sp. NPDC059571]|uniref:TadE/TadG family type IV pilus assembly protein n=1 Tax=Kitasatospora sp. NPDC059571 TaxID=3346871 RepID=UPI0036B133CE
MSGARRPDGGSVPIEAALLVPVVLAFVLMVVAAGRVQTTGAVVDAAARAGARAASLARTDDGADQAAADAVQGVLGRRGVHCRQDPGSPLTRGTLTTGAVQLGTVTVRVRCTVPLSDLLGVDGVPGEKTMTGEFTSVVDRYRGD